MTSSTKPQENGCTADDCTECDCSRCRADANTWASWQGWEWDEFGEPVAYGENEDGEPIP